MITARKATKTEGADWATEAKSYGFTVNASGGIVRLRATFPAGDVAAYARVESDAYDMAMQVPCVAAGSVWGDTSDGVGGAVALERGSFCLKVSGVSKRFAAGVA